MKRLDRSKPPPGWIRRDSDGWERDGFCMLDPPLGYAVKEEVARRWTEQNAQPYIDDALAQLVEFLRHRAELSFEKHYTEAETPGIAMGVYKAKGLMDTIIELIEQGEWRK